jgi:ubiquinone/menaquinone biosynthesis C-methylase UbiE
MTHDLGAWDAPGTYDDNAPDYAAAFDAYWSGTADHLADMMDPQPGDKHLDVGTGPGRLALLVAERVGPSGHVTAIDPADGMLKIAEERAAQSGLSNLTIRDGNMHDLRFEPRSLDSVSSALNMYFANSVPAVLRAYAQLVTPGGRVGISTCGEQFFAPLGAHFIRTVEAVRPDISTWVPWRRTEDPCVVLAMFRAAGFSDVHLDVEDITVELDGIDDWWAIAKGTGYSRILRELGDDAPLVLLANEAYMEANDIRQVTFEVIYAVGIVPPA